MKIFLLEVLIRDGEHEHRDHALVKAMDEKEARALGQLEVMNGDGYWSYGDGQTDTLLRDVKYVMPHEAQIVEGLGLVHYIN
jgi:hypothetical protein